MAARLQDQQQQSTQPKKFRSPTRVLVAFFQKSRDQWKQKYMSIKQELKRLKVRVYDVTKSREHWKQLAQEHQEQVKELQGEVQELQSQLVDAKKNDRP